MLGTYQSFPENVQKIAYFVSSVSYKRLQKAMIEAFCKLNTENLRLEDFGVPSISGCRVIFELGIAEGQTFNYVDDDERKRVLKSIEDKPFHVMDFLSVIRYHKMLGEKATPLKFDYYMLRFIFDKDFVELRVFHEKGSMHVAPDELTGFLHGKINGIFSRKILKAVKAS
jgi:hypothetical protein